MVVAAESQGEIGVRTYKFLVLYPAQCDPLILGPDLLKLNVPTSLLPMLSLPEKPSLWHTKSFVHVAGNT